MVNHEEFEVDYQVESQRKGITGSVTSYTFASLEYPYILIDDLTKVGTKAKLLSLKGIITPPATKEIVDKLTNAKSGASTTRYNIYTDIEDGKYLLGTIVEDRLISIIDSIGLDNVKELALNKDQVFTGTMIYTMVPVRS